MFIENLITNPLEVYHVYKLKACTVLIYIYIINGGQSGRADYGIGFDACRRRFESRPRAAFLSGQATVFIDSIN